MTRDTNAAALPDLKRTFDADGPRAALAFLNSLTDQRFTSMYRFDGPNLHAITFYDRENPQVNASDDIPVHASYCVFVRDSGRMVAISASLTDERVVDHPKRTVVQSYCGVPLFNQQGKMFGTVCHFDTKPGKVADVYVELLEYMAQLLQKRL